MKLEVSKTFYRNQQIATESHFLKSQKHGVCREWYENGHLKSEINFRHNQKHGFERSWYENGQLAYESQYKDDKWHGAYKSWYKNGAIRALQNWDNGFLHGVSCDYDPLGNEKKEYYWYGKKLKYTSEHAELMAQFLSNLGYTVVSPQHLQQKNKILNLV